jgi:hypothetical protein
MTGNTATKPIPANLSCGKRGHNRILCGFEKPRAPEDARKCWFRAVGKKVAEGVARLQLH